jgi:hypothetical protein
VVEVLNECLSLKEFAFGQFTVGLEAGSEGVFGGLESEALNEELGLTGMLSSISSWLGVSGSWGFSLGRS